jgi:hypothetical protein
MEVTLLQQVFLNSTFSVVHITEWDAWQHDKYNENRFVFMIKNVAFNTKQKQQHPYMIFPNKQLWVEI